MGLLDAYQDSTDRALTVMAARPIDPEPPKPKHSGWSTIPRAVAGAFVETAGNIMDVASAYGQVQAATGANANPLIPDSPEDRKQRLEAFDKLKTGGIDWQPEESRPHYQMARDLRPDPITAGAAENIVFGLTKGLTKAIGASMIAGPVAGAGAFGVSEGMTTAEDLAAQGVDPVTRQKVGAVVGAVSAAGMALPVAGSTLAKTAALVAAGGPASFVAQQAATRAILESADYGRLAQQYDPLDPTGLAIATLLPAGFATWANAGAISAALKGKPKTVLAEGAPAEPVKPVATQEQVDAAMVHNLTIARDVQEATGPAQVESIMRVSLEEADRLIANQQRRFSDSQFFAARQAAVDEMNMRDSEFSFQRPAEGVIPTQAEIGARIVADQFRSEAMQRIANGEQLIQLPDAAIAQAEALLNEGASPATGGILAVDVRYSHRQTDAGTAVGDQAGRIDRPTGQLAEQIVGAGDTAAQPAHPDPHIASVLSRAEALKAQQPDMPVAVREDGTHATLAEELDAIRQQAKEGTADTFGADDAPLIQVAVECLLSIGAGSA